MNQTDIENAMMARLGNAGLGISIAWPNVDFDDSRPYLDVSFAGGDRIGGSLKGNEIERASGIMQVAVATDLGIGTDTAKGWADQVAALYPEGTRISITGGTVLIPSPPSIRAGLIAGAEWRVPVLIAYTASK